MKPSFQLPPLYREAQKMLKDVELAVLQFNRAHKYMVGADLRREAMMVMRLIHHTIAEKSLDNVIALQKAIEHLKLTLQLAKEVGAFKNMVHFAPLAQLAVSMSKQCGGWRKSIEQKTIKKGEQDAIMSAPQ